MCCGRFGVAVDAKAVNHSRIHSRTRVKRKNRARCPLSHECSKVRPGAQSAALRAAPGKIAFRFHSRDLHMVLGPQNNGMPVRFKVTLDGATPGGDCGSDSAPDGTDSVREPRLYQLIRQKGRVENRTLQIEFLDPGVQAFSFTFG